MEVDTLIWLETALEEMNTFHSLKEAPLLFCDKAGNPGKWCSHSENHLSVAVLMLKLET